MKNAPKIDHQQTEISLDGAAVITGAMAQRQRARVSEMAAGNTIELPLPGGQRKKFTLVIVPAEQVKKGTMVSPLNQRDQRLLTEQSLADILPSVILHGILEPGMGRKVNGIIELGKGSRRRQCALLAGVGYPALVGDLTDQEMADLDRISNYYLEPSPFERGRWYCSLLNQPMSLREIEQYLDEIGEPASRRDITRCIRTSELPIEVIEAFDVPNDVSPRLGDQLYSAWEKAKSHSHQKGQKMVIEASFIKAERQAGNKFSADQVRNALLNSVSEPKKEIVTAPPEKRSWGRGKVKMSRSGSKTRLEFANLTPEQTLILEEMITAGLGQKEDKEQQLAFEVGDMPDAWSTDWGFSPEQADEAWAKLKSIIGEFKDSDKECFAPGEPSLAEKREAELHKKWSELSNPKILLNIRMGREWVSEQIKEMTR